MTQNRSSAVMQQRSEPHDSLDDFPTQPWGTRALCEFLAIQDPLLKTKRAWEPACNRGYMSRPLSEYFETVYSSDVHPYGFGAVRDFLFPDDEPPFDWIISNPPFRLAETFAKTAMDRARYGTALLVRSAFTEGVGRYENLYRLNRPNFILQFAERLPLVKGRVDPKASTATSYCWLVWRTNMPPPAVTIFTWIPPCRKRLERPGDYD